MERRDYELNGKMYSILLPPVTAVMPIVYRAGVLAGSLLGEVSSLRGMLNISASKNDKIEAVLKTIGPLISKINPVELNSLCMDAVAISNLVCDGKSICAKIDFERHFAVNRSETLQVMLWCLWESTQDFFPWLGELAQTAKAAAKGVSPSQKVGE